MHRIFFVFAIAGGVLPYFFFSQFFAMEGFDLQTFIKALFVNGAAGGFSTDLLISSGAFWVWIFSRPRTGPHPMVFVVVNLGIGLSCAFPLYLYYLTRPEQKVGVEP